MEAARLACDTPVGLSGTAIGSPPACSRLDRTLREDCISDVLPFPAWDLRRGQNKTVARRT